MGGGVPIQASLLFNVLGVLVRALFAQFREAAAAVLFYSFLIFSFLTPSITLFSFFFARCLSLVSKSAIVLRGSLWFTSSHGGTDT